MNVTQEQTNTNVLTFVGTIDIVTHANQDTGFGILKLRVDPKDYGHYPCVNRRNQVTLIGNIARICIGEKVQVTGVLKQNKTWGPQIEVTQISVTEPRTQTEITRYLAQNVFQIGKKTAEAIVKKFGEATLKVITESPDRLLEVPGIGSSRLEEIKRVWVEQQGYRDLLLFTTSIGLSATFLERIYKKYKENAIQKIKDDPYALSRDIWGIGFSKADEVAKHLGIHELSEIRIRAASESLLYEAAQDGHCFLYIRELIQKTCEFLEHPSITEGVVIACLKRAIEIGIMVCEDANRVYLPDYAMAENQVVRRLEKLIKQPRPARLQEKETLDSVLTAAAKSSNVQLDTTQCEAIYRTLTSKVSVITGGPGTGKTTLTRAVCAGFESAGLSVTLLAPTGRAAKRMQWVIDRHAQTIHRLLFSLEKRFRTGEAEDSLLIRGVVIVDEFSMVDVKLFSWLLRWISPESILVIVGDKDQLPSVSAGAVLRDLLDAKSVAVTVLSHIFRQAQGSQIIVNAHKINQGAMPDWTYFGRNHGYPTQSNMWVAMIDDGEEQAEAALWCVSEICKSYGFEPTRDCQVLAPMKNGAAGVINLNTKLQLLLNPKPPQWVERGGGVRWGVGDKVMQMRNNYPLGVLNGDIGIIVDIAKKDDGGSLDNLTVDFDGEKVTYEHSEDWSGLQLAYASTIHKVQGSEFPIIIMLLHTSHYMMLQRNLLYTGITRGKKMVILIACGSALSRAISNNEVTRRNTWLGEKLQYLAA